MRGPATTSRSLIHQRTGDAQMIGNFSPIWVNWKGKKIMIEELLDSTQ